MVETPELYPLVGGDAATTLARVASTKLAGPWTRFWARSVDLAIFTSIVSLPVGFVFGDAINKISSGSTNTLLFTIFLLPFAFLLDALSQYVFKGSIGKLLTGISLVKLDGKTLTFVELLTRDFHVWSSGYAGGLPLVSLFTLGQCYSAVKSGRGTSWDKSLSTNVLDRNANIYRTTLAAIAYVIIQVSILWLSVYASEKMDNAEEHARQNLEVSLNKSLPTQVDAWTRLVRIDVGKNYSLAYNYTIVDKSGNAPAASVSQLSHLLQKRGDEITKTYCGYSGFNRANGSKIPVSYIYRLPNSTLVGEKDLNSKDCA